ncbi:MAG: saccharopine dehydrogenase NADP-binding domain-containing protein [Dehalococcoidia bacterium]|nr:saccharopine dehydrogenase NADP-binding domain-containing protein [Dehalococcoidia bacterium]
MKKILIIGAGAQGGACASILSRDNDVSRIVLGDLNLDLANKVKDKIKSDKISTTKVNAGKIEDIEKAAKGVDVIINLTLCRFNPNIMEAALNSGAHYVDTAFDDPIWTQLTKPEPLEISSKFKTAGLTALIGCGGAPGVVNVLTRYICDKLDTIDEIAVKVGDKFLGEHENVVRTWEPTWCPEIALTDYVDEPTVFENGKYIKYPAFSGLEEYAFPEPVGKVLIGYHHHEEAVTLPHFIGKGVKNVGFKYPIDLAAAAFVKMGFASSSPIEVKGSKVAPMDVLMKLVHRPSDTFLAEDENTAKLPPRYAHPYLVEVSGEKKGTITRYKIWWPSSLFSTVEEKQELYRKFGTTKVSVALPSIVGAKMCTESNTKRGVISPECLDPIRFLNTMTATGWSLKFDEVCSKQVAIS